MPKFIFRIVVTFLTLIVLFTLVACGGTTSTQTPSSTAPPETTTPTPTPTPPESPSVTPTVPVSPTSTPETTIPETTSTTTTTTTTPTSSTPPPPPPAAADLKPFPVEGNSIIVADISSKDYHEFKIKAGITNSGTATATSVTVNLYSTGNNIHTWNVEQVAAGENVILETTVGEILSHSTFTPGIKFLNIEIFVADSSKETGGNNKSAAQDITIAPPPAERRQHKSEVEKMIQDSIDNATWYTKDNQSDLITIIKEVLKDARIQWSMVHIELKAFDDFNKFCSENYGSDEQGKKDILKQLENDRLKSFSFLYGTTTNPQICLREGTLVQLLPVLFTRLGDIAYSQANYSAYTKSWENGSLYLIEMLLNAYAVSVLRDNFGFDGLAGVSALSCTIPNLNVQNNISLKRVWAVTTGAGYTNGDVPSAEILKIYLNLLSHQTPDTYMENLDKQVKELDVAAVTNIIRWRLVNKQMTPLPEEIVTKIDPGMTSFSLDNLIANQVFIMLPW